MTIIAPTVGRIVWYVQRKDPPKRQPLAALVTYVHDDRLVNLAVFTVDGRQLAATSVILVQEGDPKPDDSYCKWMPYQLGQAKKHAE